MDEISTTGLDIAKNVFQGHGADASLQVDAADAEALCKARDATDDAVGPDKDGRPSIHWRDGGHPSSQNPRLHRYRWLVRLIDRRSVNVVASARANQKPHRKANDGVH